MNNFKWNYVENDIIFTFEPLFSSIPIPNLLGINA